MSKKHKNKAIRIRVYSLKEIFDFLRHNPFTVDPSIPKWRAPKKQYYVDSDDNKMSVRRARVFYEKGIRCKCGLEGQFFALEKWEDGGLHLDLFAIDSVGDEVLMTVDHVNPKSKSGTNSLDNYDTLCKICNEEKADIVITA